MRADGGSLFGSETYTPPSSFPTSSAFLSAICLGSTLSLRLTGRNWSFTTDDPAAQVMWRKSLFRMLVFLFLICWYWMHGSLILYFSVEVELTALIKDLAILRFQLVNTADMLKSLRFFSTPVFLFFFSSLSRSKKPKDDLKKVGW